MAEILPGVHQIAVDYKGRALNLYLLIGETASLLMDAGDAAIPEKDILPYFEKIGFDPKRLTYVMATHPDLDHTGGLFRMKQAAPQALFCCGTVDRAQCETPEGLIDLRYRAYLKWHGLGPDDEARAKMLPRCGGPVAMAFTLAGGEEIRLGPKQLVRVLHLPGHSHGHLGVHLPEENVAIIGDAVHGRANFFMDGKAAFACTYMHVDEYLETIERLKTMRLKKLFSCHWPDCTSAEMVSAWLEESRKYAMEAEEAILRTVREAGGAGLTLREVCVKAKGRLGDWPAEKDMETRSMACGHLERLEAAGMLRQTATAPVRFIAETEWTRGG